MNSLVRLVLPDVQDLLREGSPEDITAALAPFHSADIADLVESLPDEDARKLLLGLDEEQRVQTFEQLELDQQHRMVALLGPAQAAPIVSEMAADDRADLIGQLDQDQVSDLLDRLPAKEAKDVAVLTNYAEDAAGGIMTTEFVRLSPDMTAREAIDKIREQAPSRETIYALYVLDENRRLLGVVSLTKLITSPPETKVREIMYENPISVAVDEDQESVVRKLGHYDFLAIPVLDGEGRMVGIVTHDDVLDVAIEEADEDAHMLGGVQPLDAPYFATGVATLVRKRAVWLTVLLFAGLGAGTILRGFESTLERTMALIFFLPLIIASGGNSGSQSATLVIRGLAVGEMKLGDWLRIAQRELISGLALGLLLGVFGVIIAVTWGKQEVATTVFATLIAIVTVGSLLGSLMPLGLARIGIDPAITSSPLVAGLVDILGVLIYVLIAGVLL